MNTTTYISQKLSKFPQGRIFSYEDLSIDNEQLLAASKALSRLVAQGTIMRFQKGKYYVPKQSMFGILKPSDTAILDSYLFENKKQVAYITGMKLYNSLGLTTQVPTTVTIASWNKQININTGSFRLKSKRSYLTVTRKNVPYLQLLDVIKDFKRIVDSNNEEVLFFLKEKLNGYSIAELKRLVGYAKNYPPKVNALLGALLEAIGINEFTSLLKQKINTLSRYSFGINKQQLPTIENWNIV